MHTFPAYANCLSALPLAVCLFSCMGSLSVQANPDTVMNPASQYTYICTYFDGHNETGLQLAGSQDGYAWESIPVDFRPAVGDWKIFRDPSFDRGPDGRFHMVWTTGSNGFGYASSSDLLSWSEPRFIPVNRGLLAGETAYTWAPELMYDEESGSFLILVTVAREKWEGPGWCGNFHIYSIRTSDFVTFSEPRPLFDPVPPFYEIDAALVRFKDLWYCFFKIEDSDLSTPNKEKDGIHFSTAPSPDGPWSAPSPQRLPANQPNSEGPSPIVIDGQLVVFYDLTPGLRAARSGDGRHFEDVSAEIGQPPQFRHGTIRRVKPAPQTESH